MSRYVVEEVYGKRFSGVNPDTPFKLFMFFFQYNNVFVLKRVLSGFEVGINGKWKSRWFLTGWVSHVGKYVYE